MGTFIKDKVKNRERRLLWEFITSFVFLLCLSVLASIQEVACCVSITVGILAFLSSVAFSFELWRYNVFVDRKMCLFLCDNPRVIERLKRGGR